MDARGKYWLLGACVVFGLFSHILSGGAAPHIPALNPYYYDVLLGIGINIILAVGLNLVNGYTGQFSLGHAGFMAVGAYAASMLVLSAVASIPCSLVERPELMSIETSASVGLITR